MQIDQERLEALRPQLQQHGVDVGRLPAPGTPEWDGIVRDLNLKNPVLAQEFAGLGYDPAELANSELVERQASRAASRRGPLDAFKAPFRTKTVNGDTVPNTSLVRNILLSTAAAGAIAFYFLVPSDPNKAEASATGTTIEEPLATGTGTTDTGTPDDGVPTPEASGVTAPDEEIPTNTLADTPLPPDPDQVAAINDPTGIGDPAPTPPDTLDIPPGLSDPAPADQAPTPIVFNAPPQTDPSPAPAPSPDLDTPMAPSPASPASSPGAPRASAPIVIRDPGTGGGTSVPVPTLARTSNAREGGEEARVGLSRTGAQGEGAAAESPTRARTLSGTRASGESGESAGGENAGAGTTRGLSATQAGNTEGSTPYALRTTQAAEGNRTSTAGLTGRASAGGAAAGETAAATAPTTGLRSSAPAGGEAGGTRGYGLASTGRASTEAGNAAPSGGTSPAAEGPRDTARTAQTSGNVGLLSSASSGSQASGGGQGAARAYGLSGTATQRNPGAAEGSAAAQATQAVAAAVTPPAAPYAVGRPVQAKLTLGVGVVEGADQAASLPVYAESEDGAMWRGTAVLDGRGRVRVAFDAVLRDGREYPLVADAYGADGLPGVPARVRLTTPNLAATLLSGLASGVKSFAEAMVNQRQVSVQPGVGGGNVVTNSSANTPNFWLLTAGSTLGSVTIPQGKGGMVNVAEVQPGAALQIVVRRTSRGE